MDFVKKFIVRGVKIENIMEVDIGYLIDFVLFDVESVWW